MALPQVTATGNVTDSPTLRHTKTGTAVLNVRVACNERKKDENNNWVDARTVFLNVTVWGDKAEAAAEALDKGVEVTVVGRLSEREYQDKNGNPRTQITIDADTIAATIGRVTKPVGQAPAYDAEVPF